MTLEEIEKFFLPVINNLETEPEENSNLETQLMEYYEKYNRNEYLLVQFDRGNREGIFEKVIGLVTIRMEAKNLGTLPLRQQICCKIVDINDSGIINVSNLEARKEQKPAILTELNQALQLTGAVTVKGKIIQLHKRIISGEERTLGAWLDICGVGIPGFLAYRFWALPEKLNEKLLGKTIEVVIFEKKQRTKHTILHYECRMPDMVKINDNLIGSSIQVQCTERTRTMWYGTCDAGICYGNYPKDMLVLPGFQYEGEIVGMHKKRGLSVALTQATGLENWMQGGS